jgi:hypothetical protein
VARAGVAFGFAGRAAAVVVISAGAGQTDEESTSVVGFVVYFFFWSAGRFFGGVPICPRRCRKRVPASGVAQMKGVFGVFRSYLLFFFWGGL